MGWELCGSQRAYFKGTVSWVISGRSLAQGQILRAPPQQQHLLFFQDLRRKKPSKNSCDACVGEGTVLSLP